MTERLAGNGLLPCRSIKDNRLSSKQAVIFFCFYLRFFKRSANIIIKTINARIASTVIITASQVLLNIHTHHSFRKYLRKEKKDVTPFTTKYERKQTATERLNLSE